MKAKIKSHWSHKGNRERSKMILNPRLNLPLFSWMTTSVGLNVLLLFLKVLWICFCYDFLICKYKRLKYVAFDIKVLLIPNIVVNISLWYIDWIPPLIDMGGQALTRWIPGINTKEVWLQLPWNLLNLNIGIIHSLRKMTSL